jgi:DNA polymerase III subunit gamma/tau
MSHQVLARKYRPRRFDALVGQEHVRRALQNALGSGRLHHAYLFTGTRGVGKTTLARLLAKALNCESGPAPEPCGECVACTAIDAGRFLDLIEVDAASRTGVDDTRELLESAQYAPAQGRYKVYLIDEVHMFSKSSFNALLKTLEEPPEHVKFLLATTDPQKLPPTVLSRCLQFQLRVLPAREIAAHLARIAELEGVGAETAALEALARAARGSVRDALSLLDQALAHSGGTLALTQVHEMLGTLDRTHALRLLQAVAAGDAPAALAVLDAAAAQAADPGVLLDDVLALTHQVALAQVLPEAPAPADTDAAALAALADALPPEQVQLVYQIALHGQRDLPLAPDPRIGLEMVLLRWLAFRPAPPPGTPARERAQGGVSGETPCAATRLAEPARAAPSDAAADELGQPSPGAVPADLGAAASVGTAPADDPIPRGAEAGTMDAGSWATLVEGLALAGAARALASHSQLVRVQDGVFELALDAGASALQTAAARARLEAALTERLGRAVRVRFAPAGVAADTPARRAAQEARARAQALRAELLEDPVVQTLARSFDARLVEGSVAPDDPQETRP